MTNEKNSRIQILDIPMAVAVQSPMGRYFGCPDIYNDLAHPAFLKHKDPITFKVNNWISYPLCSNYCTIHESRGLKRDFCCLALFRGHGHHTECTFSHWRHVLCCGKAETPGIHSGSTASHSECSASFFSHTHQVTGTSTVTSQNLERVDLKSS